MHGLGKFICVDGRDGFAAAGGIVCPMGDVIWLGIGSPHPIRDEELGG